MAIFPETLMDKGAYDEDAGEIKLIQTHISWVFLAGEYAYKVKKPVNFGFLDFTTLEKRKKFCMREFEINSMFSPDLYIAVLPITKENGEIRISGRGETIEYCIKMKRLSEENLMSNLLGDGKIGKNEIDEIIRILINYYEKAESGPSVEKNATFEITAFNWKENFEQTEEFKEMTINRKDFSFVKDEVEAFMEKNKELFEKRIRDGRVKWCHGDLHSGNIFIEDGKIFIFDAIEFNERFACSDIANDVAFLAMDLDFRGFYDLSDYFVKTFAKKANDAEMMKLMDFYKCYRAYVRGKVTSFKLNDESMPESEKEKAKTEAKKYFSLARKYAALLNADI